MMCPISTIMSMWTFYESGPRYAKWALDTANYASGIDKDGIWIELVPHGPRIRVNWYYSVWRDDNVFVEFPKKDPSKLVHLYNKSRRGL